MLARLKTPLIAIGLAIFPFFVFMGTTQTIDVNGVRVTDNQFNALGIVLALIALWLCVRILLPSAPKDPARKVLAVIAILLAALQLANSVDLMRPLEWFDADSDLPALRYDALEYGNQEMMENIVASGNIEHILNDVVSRASLMLDTAHEHMAYADVCHEGRYRADYDELVALTSDLPQASRGEIQARAESMRRPAPAPESCSPERTVYGMGELVDRINRSRDMISILVGGYMELSQ